VSRETQKPKQKPAYVPGVYLPPDQSRTVPLVQHSENRRTARRYLVKWHARIYVADDLFCEGITQDLSETGAAIFVDRNLCCSIKPVKILLAIPAAGDLVGRVVELQARQLYSVLDSTQKQFRIGFKFISITRGKAAMLSRLALSSCEISCLENDCV
jgi:hypothetical protein